MTPEKRELLLRLEQKIIGLLADLGELFSPDPTRVLCDISIRIEDRISVLLGEGWKLSQPKPEATFFSSDDEFRNTMYLMHDLFSEVAWLMRQPVDSVVEADTPESTEEKVLT